MKLYQHRDFRNLITIVARERGVTEAWIEKDYYLTEALRAIAASYPTQTMLKGGTSLSKGWLLLERVSEDIDLFLDPMMFPAPHGKRVIGAKTIDGHFRKLRDAIAAHPAFRHERVGVLGGFGRVDRFHYNPLFSAGPVRVTPSVLVEAGIQSGREPKEPRPINSLLAEYLRRQGQSAVADDTAPFEMQVLHFRRTFVEKMFALHGKVTRLVQRGEPLGTNARHYADLFVLGEQEAVRAMLAKPEYDEIRRDYDEKSRRFFPKSYLPPDDMRFNNSPAFFPDPKLREALRKSYDEDVSGLFFKRDFPSFDAVLKSFETLRDRL